MPLPEQKKPQNGVNQNVRAPFAVQRGSAGLNLAIQLAVVRIVTKVSLQ